MPLELIPLGYIKEQKTLDFHADFTRRCPLSKIPSLLHRSPLRAVFLDVESLEYSRARAHMEVEGRAQV